MDTNILLESGTNELEILEFKVADNHYGINVAKIREILIVSTGHSTSKFTSVRRRYFYAERYDDFCH